MGINNIILEKDEIHIWTIDLSEFVNNERDLFNLLSVDEQITSKNLCFIKIMLIMFCVRLYNEKLLVAI